MTAKAFIFQPYSNNIMSILRFSRDQLSKEGREGIAKILRADATFSREVIENRDGRLFSFGSARNRGNHLVRMALRANPPLAVEIIARKDIREELCPGAIMLAQVAVEMSSDAALEALKREEVFKLAASSSSPYVKYIAHVAVFYNRAARFALEHEEVGMLENKNGGSLEDYVWVLHKQSGLYLLERPSGGKRSTEMVWQPHGKMHY